MASDASTKEETIMAYTFKELKHKTLADLREIAKDIQHEAVQGYTQLNKEHLLKALCTALNIHEHHDVVGVDKSGIKAKIKALKQEREKALAAHDSKQLKAVRARIKNLKKKLRQAMV
jgi:DNA-binding IclR family transcriptional regulator